MTTEQKLQSAIKLINEIAMMGCGEKAYTSDFTEFVNRKCRGWLNRNTPTNTKVKND